jgi:hypothetical protein
MGRLVRLAGIVQRDEPGIEFQAGLSGDRLGRIVDPLRGLRIRPPSKNDVGVEVGRAIGPVGTDGAAVCPDRHQVVAEYGLQLVAQTRPRDLGGLWEVVKGDTGHGYSGSIPISARVTSEVPMPGPAVSASEPIVYIDHSDIREGSLDELKAGVQGVVDFIDVREPQLIAYGFYIDEDAATMTVVAVHPDSASLEFHLEIGTPEFRKLAHLLTLTAIECYGQPSERALEQLRRKAAALGPGGAVVSIGRFAGFAR